MGMRGNIHLNIIHVKGYFVSFENLFEGNI